MKKSTTFLRKNQLITLLISGFILRLASVFFLRPAYSFDEMALFLVSRNSFPQIIDVILSERFHPPGFYFLLKLFPIDAPDLSKIILTAISFSLFFFAVVYAQRNKLIEELRLESGLMIFFSSFVFFQISGDLKQDILAMPILMLTFFILLKISRKTNNNHKTDSLFLTILLFTLFLLAYISYFVALAGVVMLFINQKAKSLRGVLFVQFLSILLYSPYAVLQYATSHDRGVWVYSYYNSLVNWLSMSLVGTYSTYWLADIFIVIFLLLFVYGLKNLLRKDIVLRGYIFLATILIPVFYLQHIFVVGRYASFFFLIASIVAGWGIDRIAKHLGIHLLPLFFALFLFSSSFLVYVSTILANNTISSEVVGYLEKKSQNKNIGFVTDHHNLQLVYKLWYFPKNNNITPVNAFVPNSLNTKQMLDKEAQVNEKFLRTENIDKLAELIKSNGLEEYIFWDTKPAVDSRFTRNAHILQALESFCKIEDIYKPTQKGLSKSLLYHFNSCRI